MIGWLLLVCVLLWAGMSSGWEYWRDNRRDKL